MSIRQQAELERVEMKLQKLCDVTQNGGMRINIQHQRDRKGLGHENMCREHNNVYICRRLLKIELPCKVR